MQEVVGESERFDHEGAKDAKVFLGCVCRILVVRTELLGLLFSLTNSAFSALSAFTILLHRPSRRGRCASFGYILQTRFREMVSR